MQLFCYLTLIAVLYLWIYLFFFRLENLFCFILWSSSGRSSKQSFSNGFLTKSSCKPSSYYGYSTVFFFVFFLTPFFVV